MKRFTIVILCMLCAGCRVLTPCGQAIESIDGWLEHHLHPHPSSVTYAPGKDPR